MRPALIKESLKHLIDIKQPAMVWGPPGVGKSEVVKQVADELDYEFVDFRLSIHETVDLRGIPKVLKVGKKEKTVWIDPSFLPSEGQGIFFLDELVQATPAMQAAASQLILNRRIGDYVLPDGWVVIAAGNRDGDRASTNKMPSHIANRFIHLNFEISVDDWADWAYQYNINPMVIAFIRSRPERLHQFDVTQKSFPTPRSWSFVSKLLNRGISQECLYELIAGTVGDGCANEFVGFMRIYQNLPDYSDIVSRPAKLDIPDNASVLYAISTMIPYMAKQKDSKNLFIYIERMPKEFQILVVLGMGKKNPDMASTREYIKWCNINQEVLMNK
jgi:hypothetical protein